MRRRGNRIIESDQTHWWSQMNSCDSGDETPLNCRVALTIYAEFDMVDMHRHFDGLVLERRNSSALAVELRLSWTNPWSCLILARSYVIVNDVIITPIWEWLISNLFKLISIWTWRRIQRPGLTLKKSTLNRDGALSLGRFLLNTAAWKNYITGKQWCELWFIHLPKVQSKYDQQFITVLCSRYIIVTQCFQRE